MKLLTECSAWVKANVGQWTTVLYLWLTLGERNFDFMRSFVKGSGSDDVKALLTQIKLAQEFLEFGLRDIIRLDDGNGEPCIGHCAKLALQSGNNDSVRGGLCPQCVVVDKLAKGMEKIAVTDADKADVKKALSYMRSFHAHQIRGAMQQQRCSQLRGNIDRGTVHVIADFKMKFMPVRCSSFAVSTSLTHIHNINTLTHTHTLALTHSHTHTLTLTHSHSHTHSLTRARSLSYTFSPTRSLSHALPSLYLHRHAPTPPRH